MAEDDNKVEPWEEEGTFEIETAYGTQEFETEEEKIIYFTALRFLEVAGFGKVPLYHASEDGQGMDVYFVVKDDDDRRKALTFSPSKEKGSGKVRFSYEQTLGTLVDDEARLDITDVILSCGPLQAVHRIAEAHGMSFRVHRPPYEEDEPDEHWVAEVNGEFTPSLFADTAKQLASLDGQVERYMKSAQNPR